MEDTKEKGPIRRLASPGKGKGKFITTESPRAQRNGKDANREIGVAGEGIVKQSSLRGL